MSTPLSNITLAGSKRYARDLAERVLWTFLQAFGSAAVLSGVLSTTGLGNVSAWQSAAVGGVAAVLSLVKGLVAKAIGDPNSASTSPSVSS